MSGTAETTMKAPDRTLKKEDVHKLSGTWRLTYALTNRLGAGGFSGRNLTTYQDLITGKPRHLYNADGNRTNGYFIERQTTILHQIPIQSIKTSWIGYLDILKSMLNKRKLGSAKK